MAIAFKFGFFGFRASAVLGAWIQSKCGNILLLALAKQHHPDSEQERQYRIRAKDFFIKYQKWGSDGNHSLSGVTSSTFGSDLKRLITELKQADQSQDVLTKQRNVNGNVYRVCWSKLKQHLERTARYDPNAE